jgi:TRAP-type C4-dicarboxylate transport system substrate-binding protein
MNLLKKIIIILILFMVISMVGYSADKIYTIRIATIYNDPLAEAAGNSLGKSLAKFTELVKEKTDGRVIIQPFYGSVLGGQVETFEQVKRGQLAGFFGQPMSSVDPRFGAWSIPYLFDNYEEVKRIVSDIDGEFFKLSEEWMKDNNCQLIVMGPSNIRGFANNKHTVVSIKDLKDLKVRTYQDPVVSLFWSKIAITQPLGWAETYSALQTKVVNGLEHPLSTFLGSIGELVSYYSDIGWQWTSGANLVVHEKVWNDLPEDLQKLVREAGIEAMEYQGQQEEENLEKAMVELAEQGYEITLLTDDQRQEWIDYGRSLDDEIAKIVGKDVFDAIMNAVEATRK